MKCSVMRCVLLLFSLSTASSHGHDPVIRRDSTVATTTAMEAEALKLVQTQQLHNAMVMIQSLSDKQAAEQQRNDKINSLLKAGKFALKASTPGKPKHPFMIAGQQSSAGGNQTMPTDTLMKQFLAANKKKQATPSTPSQSPKAVDEASHSLIKTATKISKPSGQAKSSGPPSTAKMPKMKGIKGKGVAPSASPVPSSSPVPPMPTVKLIQENTVSK